MHDNRVNQEALEEIFHMLMVINPSIEIYLLDPEGSILAFSAALGKVKRKRVGLGPIRELLEGDTALPVLGDDPRNPSATKVFTAAPIPGQGKLQGYLYVILGGETYDSIVQKLKTSYIFQLSAWVIFASLLFALIAGLVLFASLTGRLKRLANAMDAFKRGASHQLVELPSNKESHAADEIDRLGLTFTEMATRIEEQMTHHDLRTPLANLHGYIETLLLKEDSLSRQDRRTYLDTAIQHCNRLNKLVSELLELAKLDAYDISAKREPFNLSELVQDVVQKFQLKVDEKQIALSVNDEKNLPFVNADIGLIERVLENLIENAIQNTPPGGSIRLLLTPQNGEISVQVSDSGYGIPEEEQVNIFNRFYKLDKSRKSEPGHSGLGLAITKKILEIHDRSIEVASALGAGTTFTFQLPVNPPA
jgi:signal transduction histidine kinase